MPGSPPTIGLTGKAGMSFHHYRPGMYMSTGNRKPAGPGQVAAGLPGPGRPIPGSFITTFSNGNHPSARTLLPHGIEDLLYISTLPENLPPSLVASALWTRPGASARPPAATLSPDQIRTLAIIPKDSAVTRTFNRRCADRSGTLLLYFVPKYEPAITATTMPPIRGIYLVKLKPSRP